MNTLFFNFYPTVQGLVIQMRDSVWHCDLLKSLQLLFETDTYITRPQKYQYNVTGLVKWTITRSKKEVLILQRPYKRSKLISVQSDVK